MRIQSVLLMSLLGVTIAQATQAASLTNKIEGVGPNDAKINPYVCIQGSNGIQTLKYGETTSIPSGYIGAALRFGGCTEADTYLGYIGINNGQVSYSPFEGVHVAYEDRALDGAGNLTGRIVYTEIKPNFNLLGMAPSKNVNWPFVGANLSGLEFGKVIDPVVVPNLSVEDAGGERSDLVDTQAFLQSGMNTFRVPVSWGYLQLNLKFDDKGYLASGSNDEINEDYYNAYLKPLLETLTSAKVYTIVDLHAYMRYSRFGKEYSGCSGIGGSGCPDGQLVLDEHAYQNVWTQLYNRMKKDNDINMDYIMLDLMNEPVDVPDDKVFTLQAAMIKALREAGFNGYILVEGNSWSGLHSWTDQSWASKDGSKTYTNASLFSRENFKNAGIVDLDKILINAHQYLDSNYSGTHDQCVTDLTTTGPNGFNLDAFTQYLKVNKLKAIVTELGTGTDSATCGPALNQFLAYMQNNSANNKDYGFVGWTIWSTGHGWGNYNLRVLPNSYHSEIMKPYLKAE